MFVSLDKGRMQVVHKHHSVNAVFDLVQIELPNSAVEICAPDLIVKAKTDLEIKMLFRSCFPGVDDHIFISDMKALIAAFVAEMPETDLDEVELRKQAESIHALDKKAYQYVKGSFRASRPAELFAEAARDVASAVSTVAAPAVARPVRAPAAPRPTNSTPRVAGVREKIWEVADHMWEEAGKPSEKSRVLALRKQIMDKLEREGVKRTSSSNELGNWQKARIS